MKKEARGHHVYSSCYLKGFTITGETDSKLSVLKLKEQKILHKQNRKKFGKERDFNRVDIEGLDPDELEKGLSKFETTVAAAIRSVEKKPSI